MFLIFIFFLPVGRPRAREGAGARQRKSLMSLQKMLLHPRAAGICR